MDLEQKYFLHTLPNGLRIAYMHNPLGRVAYCGLAVNAGSRDEDDTKQGLAHFVEHTIFKGTARRKAWHILNRMERVGGELNAYTTKEETLVYSVFPSGYMERAVDLIADLVMNSVFPSHELDKEREVVVEEIQSYRDSPSEAIYDDFEDMLFKGSSLGHNILGTEACLEQIGTDDCLQYMKGLYVPENMVFFAVDSLPAEKIFRLAEKYFGAMSHSVNRKTRCPISKLQHFNHTVSIGSHQAHAIVGTITPGMHDKDKYALLLLNNMLGGPGMNSTLNVAIRERRGYAYTVESSLTLFSDCGVFSIYFGCDDKQVEKCLKLIDNELERIASGGITSAALEAAKKQYVGQLLVSSENPEGKALSMGRGMLAYNEITTIQQVAEQIRAVTPEQIKAIGEHLAVNCSTLTFR